MKITVKSNVTFSKLKGQKFPKLAYDNLLKPLGRAALKKVKDSFSKGLDITGQPYPEYTKSYKRWLKRNGYEGKQNNMVLKGKLKNSIPLKIFTDEKNYRVIVAPDKNKATNKNNVFYGAYHLYDNENNKQKGVRKWFFTSDELPILFDDNMLGSAWQEGKEVLEKKLESQLKTKMRKIAEKTFEL